MWESEYDWLECEMEGCDWLVGMRAELSRGMEGERIGKCDYEV